MTRIIVPSEAVSKVTEKKMDILNALLEKGKLTHEEIGDIVDLKSESVARHTKEMEQLGLVERELTEEQGGKQIVSVSEEVEVAGDSE